MKTVFFGLVIGAIVGLDPLLTTYLLQDFPTLRDMPYVLSLTAALSLGIVYTVRAFVPGIVARVIQDYGRYFAYLFLLAYQLSAFSLGSLDPTEVVIGVFFLLFVAGLFVRQDQRFVSTPFNMLHLVLGICIVLSLTGDVKMFSFLKTAKPIIVFFLLVNFLPRERVTLNFLRWLLVLAGLSAIFCLVQEVAWITAQELLTPVPKDRLERMFEDTPLGPLFRVPGLMVSYRSMALYLASALMLALGALLWNKEATLLSRRWLIRILLVVVPALLLTTAKDVLLGVGAAVVLLLILRRPSRLMPVAVMGLAGALALVVATAIIPGNVETVLELSRDIPKSEMERIRLDRDSIEGFVHGPYFWFGRGVGSGKRYTAHPLGWPAHNAFILVAAELGLAGLLVYLAIYGWVFARAVALNIMVTSGPYLPIVRGLLAALVVGLVGAQFEASYLDIYVWTIFAVVEAIWFQLRRQPVAAAGDPTAPSPKQA